MQNSNVTVRRRGDQIELQCDAATGAFVVAPGLLVSHLFSYVKSKAEQQCRQTVNSVVLTVPAHFSSMRRAALAEAAIVAGLTVVAVIAEPTAAAISYGLLFQGSKSVLVVDIGGGTTDIAVVSVDGDTGHVAAVGGDGSLGGNDFTSAIAALATAQLSRATAHGNASVSICAEASANGSIPTVTDAAKAAQGPGKPRDVLFDACEAAKCTMSSTDEAAAATNSSDAALEVKVPLKSLLCGASEASEAFLTVRVSRQEVHASFMPLLGRLEGVIQSTLKDASLTAADIQEVVIVGTHQQCALVALHA